ncbi:MAG TPA: TraR/DksA family transcriptional regulator [Anaeromyxobacteraceae bacterium]|nr:TraR/DksA family transcriptional regulator [Anaeromyxobacteraceae bacterium]
MSGIDLAKVMADLQRRRRQVLAAARRAEAEIDGLRAAGRDPEFEEGAQSDAAQQTLSTLGEAQRGEIGLIDAAIARVEAGRYGICRDCEQPIDPRRLAALPYALHCAECAERRTG